IPPGASPSSPFVHVTTTVRKPSSAYRARTPPVLDDSSSGCACTAIKVNGALIRSACQDARQWTTSPCLRRDFEFADEVIGQRHPVTQIDHSTGAVALEMIRDQPSIACDLLRVLERARVGELDRGARQPIAYLVAPVILT